MPSWLEALLTGLRRAFGEAVRPESTPSDAPVAWLRLDESAQPLLASFVEPAIRVEVRGAVPVVHVSDTRAVTVALRHNRVVAVRYRYPFRPDQVTADDWARDAARFLAPEARAIRDYQLLGRPNGWLLAIADCPEAWLTAVDEPR